MGQQLLPNGVGVHCGYGKAASPGNHQEADANGAQQYANHDGKYSLDRGQSVATHNPVEKDPVDPDIQQPQSGEQAQQPDFIRSFIASGLKLNITPPLRS